MRRVVAVTPQLEARGDTAGALALGAHAYELDADHVEIARALAGMPAASPLFVGHDGVSYERAYAPVGEAGDVAGLIAVEGNAEYPAALAAFRRSMLVAGGVAALGVLLVTLWLAGRISGPVTRLAEAAARLGRGDLEAPFPIETRDEIGVLARTFEETRQALKARDERMQMMLAGIAHEVRNPLGGLELYAGLLREALGDQPERLEEVRRIEREVGHLKTVVSDFLEFARPAAPRLEPVQLDPLCREVAELARAGSAARVDVEVGPGRLGEGRSGPVAAGSAESGPQRRGRRPQPRPAGGARGGRANPGRRAGRRRRGAPRAARPDLHPVFHDPRERDWPRPGVRARDRARSRGGGQCSGC